MEANADAGFYIDGDTHACTWDGPPGDWGMCVEAVMGVDESELLTEEQIADNLRCAGSARDYGMVGW
jgi:hypothetical protein